MIFRFHFRAVTAIWLPSDGEKNILLLLRVEGLWVKDQRLWVRVRGGYEGNLTMSS